MSIKAVALMAEGFEETEAIAVIDLMRRAKFEVTVASIGSRLEVKSSHGIVITAEELFEPDKYANFDLIFLPGGGLGTQNLAADNRVLETVKKFYDQDKYVAAICAAPYVLHCAGILEGKNFTCYPGFETKIVGNFKTDKVVIDGKIFTSRGMGTAIDLGLAIVGSLAGKEQGTKLAESIVYK